METLISELQHARTFYHDLDHNEISGRGTDEKHLGSISAFLHH